MSVYIIASIAIEDREEYEKYQAGFPDVFSRYKGELLAVSDDPQLVEGEWPYTRAVVLRFPDADEARRWYESPEYQALAKHRWQASTASIISVAGLS
ncbi:MAG: DUF1330 domain-containing protein [bacterium]|nr:DUF1330 domain-containing protein [bacterium]